MAENNNDMCKNCKKLQKTMQQIRRRYLAGINSMKVIHASKDVLAEKVNEQRKIIKLKIKQSQI